MNNLHDVADALPRLEEAAFAAADWLADHAQVKTAEPSGVENRVGHQYCDWRGAFRGEYRFPEPVWWFFCPMWHGAQAVKALLAAGEVSQRASWREAAVLGGDFILRHRVHVGPDAGLLLAYEDFPDKVTVSALLESLDGLFALSRHTNDQRYADVALDALRWCARRAWVKGQGLVRDLYDLEAGRFVENPYPTLPGRAGRPLADDAAWLTGAHKSLDAALCGIFYEILRRLLADETPAGNWADYGPCLIDSGRIHPRHAYWWGRPFLAAWRDTGEQPWLDAAGRAGDWYRRAQRLDGGLFRETNLHFNTTSFGHCTSGVVCAAILWIELFQATSDPVWLEPIRRALEFSMRMQLRDTADPSTRGALIEGAYPPDGSDRCPYFIRDLASIFFVQAAAALLRACASAPPDLSVTVVPDAQARRLRKRSVTQ